MNEIRKHTKQFFLWPRWYAVTFGLLFLLLLAFRALIGLPVFDGPEIPMFVWGLLATTLVSLANEYLPSAMFMRGFVLGFAWAFSFFASGGVWFWLVNGTSPSFDPTTVTTILLLCIASGWYGSCAARRAAKQ